MKNIPHSKWIKNAAYIIIPYLLVSLLLTSGILSRQYRSLLVPIGINIILAVSLNLVTGFLGELSLGHAGFMSIGAYTSALITTGLTGLPDAMVFAIALGAAILAAAIFGFLIGVPVLRLRGDYLAIVTLAFGEIIKSLINAFGFTGGAKGLSKIPLYSDFKNYTLVFVFVVLSILFISNFVHSRDGRAIMAIRDNDIAAESVGIRISKYKVAAFVVGAMFAGLAGALYAHNVGIIKPGTFDYNKSIEILVIVVLGGMGNIPGSIISALILTVLPELLRGADEFRMLLYSVVLILMMIVNHSYIKAGLLNNKVFAKLLKGRER